MFKAILQGFNLDRSPGQGSHHKSVIVKRIYIDVYAPGQPIRPNPGSYGLAWGTSLKVLTLNDDRSRTQAWVLRADSISGGGVRVHPRLLGSSPPIPPLLPSIPTLNHHLTTTDLNTRPRRTPRALSHSPTDPTGPQSPQNPFGAGESTPARFQADPTRSDPIRSGTEKLLPGVKNYIQPCGEAQGPMQLNGPHLPQLLSTSRPTPLISSTPTLNLDMSTGNDQSRLDLYMKAQELDSHPALKPKEQAHVKCLLALIKADIENSDDEDEEEHQSRDIPNDPPFSANSLAGAGAAHQIRDDATGLPAPNHSLRSTTPSDRPPVDLSLPTRPDLNCPTPTRDIHREGDYFALPSPIGPPRTACSSFANFSRVDPPSVVDNGLPNVLNPAYAYISDDPPRRKNANGETSILTAEGDKLYDSIMASVNKEQLPPQNNPAPPVPTPSINKQVQPAPPKHQTQRREVIHERQERRPNYRFDNVRLEGVEDNDTARGKRNRIDDSDDDAVVGGATGKSTRTRIEDSEGNTDAEGSTDEEYVSKEQTCQVAVILDHGIGRPAPFRQGPQADPSPHVHPLLDDFASWDLLSKMNIPRSPMQGGSRQPASGPSRKGAGGEGPRGPQSARAPSVELFVPGVVLPSQEVNRWNTELSGGIKWTHQSTQSSLANIKYILEHLPPLISAHDAIPKDWSHRIWMDIDRTSKACETEDILKTAGNLSLITSDMVNRQPHGALLPHLASFFAPGRLAYIRLQAALQQTWAMQKMTQMKDTWIPQAFDNSNNVYTAYTHLCDGYENMGGKLGDNSASEPGVMLLIQYFIGALAGLAYLSGGCIPKPKQTKINVYRTKHHLHHVQMLANLMIFGPTAAFTAYRMGPHVTLSNALSLLEVGASLLKQKVDHGITAPMPHAILDNLWLYFLKFIIKMGFTNLNDEGVPQVNWKDVHEAFYHEFATHVITHMFAQDIEIALAEKRFGVD
ncbi:uncharacterized protein PGTG_14546 [Puccinia graminis f. sp. tritici CRL 75-36-700-3]|uniref:Uncharacterized protein n=1 Tax=Puccinia graminis f. sp. tritici (strain CRL 75-36-700-3 / race SCCL) TaxID=418459 RepID=E3KU56_PUCGT|nr:uncharacterized protein PGTG_14546 [Puccinia graminis f. sp. tritici CRL 75-36-700-3]EFP87831.2 hypothetical protein PGTG_14546 [Puccinia graminis f. sp. tritici CRL 75-36-700-3]